VLLLDEPTNDLDTEMLRAMEDLLDTWPGTLIVVSHDRYLLERITDEQYAIIDGQFRHLPGGVDEYLRLEKPAGEKTFRDVTLSLHATAAISAPAVGALRPGSKEHRDAEKEHSRVEKKIHTLTHEITLLDHEMAALDQSDYSALSTLAQKRQRLSSELDDAEAVWLELGEQLS